MGSGGMVVMDENNCMVEIARFFLELYTIGILWQMYALSIGDFPVAGDPYQDYTRKR